MGLRFMARVQMDCEPDFNPKFKMICLTIYYVSFITLSIITWVIIDNTLEGSPELEKWKKNYEAGGCGKLDMTYALQNSCLNGCGFQTVPVGFLIAHIYRNKICPFLVGKYKTQDSWPNLTTLLVRVLCFGLAACIVSVPGMTIKITVYGGNSIPLMFSNVIIPSIILSYYTTGGGYDYLVDRFTKIKRSEE